MDEWLSDPLWLRLPLARGCSGGARCGSPNTWHWSSSPTTKGDSSGTGDTGLFLACKRLQVVPLHLAGAHLGSAGEEAQDWLVVDQQQQPSLATQEAARWHLVAQWLHYHHMLLEYTQTELGRLLDNLKEAPSLLNWPAKLAQTLLESRAYERLMSQWLEARQAPQEQS